MKPPLSQYARAIWEEFAPWRDMRPIEFAVIEGWYRRDVPVRAVCQVFEQTKVKGKGLTYYVPAVDEELSRLRRAGSA